MSWVLHPAAQDELDELTEHFAAIDFHLVSAFKEDYFRHQSLILRTPEMFRERIPKVRRVNLAPRFHEYFLAYMVWNQRIVILAVGHGKRRPHYFRHRVAEARRIF